MVLERYPSIIEQRPIPCIVEPPKSKLIEINYKRDVYPYLGHEVHCIFCLRINKKQCDGLITREHLVPKEAKEMYPDSLGILVGSRWNHIRICAQSHQVLDGGERGKGNAGFGGKIHTLRNYGIPGLVEFLANYPRAIDPVYKTRQELQFVNLFGFLEERLLVQLELSKTELMNIDKLYKPKIISKDPIVQVPHPSQVIEECYQAGNLIEEYMNEWKNGNFANSYLKAA